MALEVDRAEGCWIYAADGRRFLDLISGISVSNIGHSHPRVVEAIRNQAGRYLHTLVYGEHIQAPQVKLARKIAGTLPPSLSRIFFVNSGSEAIEGAMKLARRATGRFFITGCDHAYHGSTQGALSLNGDERYRRNFRPLVPGIRQIRFGHTGDLARIDEEVAAVVVETVQGEAGVRVAPPGWFRDLRKRCSDTGALLILDEIQCGFGRTGSFWAFSDSGIEPDVVVMAKAMGAGLPLGAFAASQELMEKLTYEPVLGHISTFGGHPLSCAGALAGLEVLLESGWIEQVRAKESWFRDGLRHPAVSEIRSSGLLMALELGSFAKVQQVIGGCMEQGILTDWFLHCDTALRIAPPLSVSEEEAEFACAGIRLALDRLG